MALFQSLDGESLEDYTNRLFRYWKPGSAKANDGVLFAVYVQDRRWRVEVGYGLEPVLTDLEAAEMARAGVPYFQSGDYMRGVSAVVDRLAARLSGVAPRPRGSGRNYSDEERTFLLLAAVIPGLLFVLGLVLVRSGQSRTIGRRKWRRVGDWPRSRSDDWGGFGGFGGWGGGLGGGGWGGGGGGFIGGGGSSGGGGASGGW